MGREPPEFELRPLGDRAWLARFPRDDRAASWARAIAARRPDWLVDLVVAYDAVAVVADPDRVEVDRLPDWLRSVGPAEAGAVPGRTIVVPVVYDGEDLAEVAHRLGLSAAEVVARHASAEFEVQAIGFLPGFPYLGPLPEALAGLPRRDRPRTRVPAGSVAIAGRQSCIYPSASPGGWHLIGRTALPIADLEAGAFTFEVGDRVRFEPLRGPSP